MSVLSAQRVRQAADRLVVGPDWEDHDLVFATPTWNAAGAEKRQSAVQHGTVVGGLAVGAS